MRSVLALLLLTGTAAADSFGGFAAVDAPYLVNQDRVCAPLEVANGQATGAPKCEKVAADDIAKLTIKPGTIQSGAKATYAASASGTTLTIKKNGSPAVVWKTADPIGRVVDVFASQYEDRVAVTFTTRRLGKETTEVVAFVIVKTTGREQPPGVTPPTAPPTPTGPASSPAHEDPELTKALDAAHKADKKKALAAWQKVRVVDPANAEAGFRIASIHAQAKQNAEATASLEELAKSMRIEAVEWLVEARFDAAFAALRSDPKFRAAVGLDRPAKTGYERVMGFGGQWEQTGTSCDAPEIRMTLKRDRTVKLNVKSSCNGQVFDLPFKGTWRLDDPEHVTLSLPTKGQAATAKDEAPCVLKKHGEEDALHCAIGKDLDFEVLPTRR